MLHWGRRYDHAVHSRRWLIAVVGLPGTRYATTAPELAYIRRLRSPSFAITNAEVYYTQSTFDHMDVIAKKDRKYPSAFSCRLSLKDFVSNFFPWILKVLVAFCLLKQNFLHAFIVCYTGTAIFLL